MWKHQALEEDSRSIEQEGRRVLPVRLGDGSWQHRWGEKIWLIQEGTQQERQVMEWSPHLGNQEV